ncbi:hypothetical protein [Nonomuraea wenchangensis]|uniref:hypothetical protein n=1 Tax=Nonomuraea wenchangensis TaxID=568860 RepID=UPI0033E21532
MIREPQILACSGVLDPPEGFRHVGAQIWQARQLAGVGRPRMCLVPTAVGDAREHIDGWLSVLPDRTAWFVEADGEGGSRETALPARRWVPAHSEEVQA